jgi:hypothetical protein
LATDEQGQNKLNGPTNKRDPWELKAIGIFFITAAIIWLFQDGEDIVTHYATGGPTGRTPQGYVEVQTQALARVYGSIALVLGCICLRLYFKLRKGPPKGRR